MVGVVSHWLLGVILAIVHVEHGWWLPVEPLILRVESVERWGLTVGLHRLWTLILPLRGHDLGSGDTEVAILPLLYLITDKGHVVVSRHELLKNKMYQFINSLRLLDGDFLKKNSQMRT